MLVPKLRFKEFTDEWYEEKLKNYAKIFDGTHETPNYINSGIKFISVENIKDLYKSTKYISEEDYTKYKIKPEKNDIFMTRIGDIGNSNIYDGKEPLAYYVSLALIKTNLNTCYINQYIKSQYFQKELHNRTIHVAFPKKINTGEIGNCRIYRCSKKEQEMIGNFLSLLDKKIELQSRKIEVLKLYKKGFIELDKNYKTEKIPFKNFLKECNNKTTINNQYNILSSTSKGLFLQSEYFNKQAASENNIGYKILKKGQLVLSPQNLWMGNININDKFEIGIVSPSYKIFNLNNNIIDTNYFNNWIKTSRALYDYLISSEQGASIVRKNLNLDLFNEIVIDLPILTIQKKIGKKLKTFDYKIFLELNRLDKLIELKKGLLQTMFV